jgi:hypothetical protein
VPERHADWRERRLWDLLDREMVVVACACGQSGHFLPGFLQRKYRVPSDTLIYDLRFRFKCSRCNSRKRIEISLRVDKWPPD